MKFFKWALLPLAVFSAFNTSGYANSFIEDSKFDLMNRNFYFYRDFREGASNSAGANSQLPIEERQGYRSEWAHGLVAKYSSGYTNTPVQIGIDAYGLVGFKLYSDELTTGTNLIEFDPKSGQTEDAYGELGAAIKLKYKDTVMTYGDQFPNVPVMAVSTVRLLPSSATGISIQDQSFDGLSVNAAHFYRMNPVDSTDDLNYFTSDYGPSAGIRADSISYIGGSYQHHGVTYTAYASELKDVWNQYFLGAQIVYPLAKEGHALRFATANYYNTEAGDAKYGDIDALALSALVGYQMHNHTFSLGYQQIIGDDPLDWVGFSSIGANPSILNLAQFATFSEAKEKSVQVKYELDFAPYGASGLSLMTRYLYGWDVDKTKSNPIYWIGAEKATQGQVDYTHWERDITLAYKVPVGFAKGLDIKLRQATHRASQGYRYNDIDELRVILEYPFTF